MTISEGAEYREWHHDRLVDECEQLREEKAALLAVLTRMVVGVTKTSTPTCKWYDGILWDAVDEYCYGRHA